MPRAREPDQEPTQEQTEMLLDTRYDLFTYFTDQNVVTEHDVFEGPLSVSYTRHHHLNWVSAFHVRVELPVAYQSPPVQLGPERIGIPVGTPGTDELSTFTTAIWEARKAQEEHIDAYITNIEGARSAWNAHDLLVNQILEGAEALRNAKQSALPALREEWVDRVESGLIGIVEILEPAPVEVPYGLLFENTLRVLHYLQTELHDERYADRMLDVAGKGNVKTSVPVREIVYRGSLGTHHVARELLMTAVYERR